MERQHCPGNSAEAALTPPEPAARGPARQCARPECTWRPCWSYGYLTGPPLTACHNVHHVARREAGNHSPPSRAARLATSVAGVPCLGFPLPTQPTRWPDAHRPDRASESIRGTFIRLLSARGHANTRKQMKKFAEIAQECDIVAGEDEGTMDIDQRYQSVSPPDLEVLDVPMEPGQTPLESLQPVGLLGNAPPVSMNQDMDPPFDCRTPSPLLPSMLLGGPGHLDPEPPATLSPLGPLGTVEGPDFSLPGSEDEDLLMPVALRLGTMPTEPTGLPKQPALGLVVAPVVDPAQPPAVPTPAAPEQLLLRPSQLVGTTTGGPEEISGPPSQLSPDTGLAVSADELEDSDDDPASSPALLLPVGPLGFAQKPAQTPSDSTISVMPHPAPISVSECGSNTTSYEAHWRYLRVPPSMQGSEFEVQYEQETVMLPYGPRTGRRDSLPGGPKNDEAEAATERAGTSGSDSSDEAPPAPGQGGQPEQENNGIWDSNEVRTLQRISDLCDDLLEHISEEAGIRWMYYNDHLVAAAEVEPAEGDDM